MTRWALVPIKTAARRKGRLSPLLSEAERIRLSLDLLAHGLDVLGRSAGIDRVALISPEPVAAPPWVAQLRDPGEDLNLAVALGVGELARRQASGVLVLLPDLPLLAPADVEAMVEAGRAHGVALAPDSAEVGTNALYLAEPAGFEFHFGEDSFRRHGVETRRFVSQPGVVRRPGLSRDLDTPDDWAALAGHASGGVRYGGGG
jgi:2-phospho-L-lactate guanylyltransferase